MAYRSKVFYTGTGSEQVLSVTFPYLDISHTHVRFDDVLQEDDTWSWVTESTIALTAASGAVVEIFRSTPYDPMVTFTNASLLNEDDQNMAALQAIYLIEEGDDITTVAFNQTRSYAITFVIEGGGVGISTGEKGFLLVPMTCTITSVYALADQTGSIECDIWVAPYADYPPTVANSIVASAPIIITDALKSLDATLTGWTTEIPRNSVLGFNINSNTGVTRLTVSLQVTVAQ